MHCLFETCSSCFFSCSDVSTTASINLEEKNNLTRLSRLLVEKGNEALRNTLDAIHPPADLPTFLNANIQSLQHLRLTYKVINDTQWNLLFPLSRNPPDSKTFDATLLTVLLRNICCLASPEEWNTIPLDTDRSPQANITRIKLLRNKVYTHVTSTRQVDKATFENFWENISQVLVDLKIPQNEVDDLRTCRLRPEDENYVDRLQEWFLKAEKCNNMLLDKEQSVQHLPQNTEEIEHTSKKGKRGEIKFFHF